MNKASSLGFLFFAGMFFMLAQTGNCQENKACPIGLPGMTPTKAIEFSYDITPGFNLKSLGTGQAIGNGTGVVNKNRQISLKFGVPIILKPSFNVFLRFKYSSEKYSFYNTNYELHQSLDDKNLKSTGASLIAIKKFRKSFIVFKGGVEFNGDFSGLLSTQQQNIAYGVSAIYGRRVNKDLEYGIGVVYGKDVRKSAILPVFLYNQNFSEKWGIEALLPSHVRVRHNLTDRTIIKLGMKAKSDSYFFHAENVVGPSNSILRMRRMEMRFGVTIEQQVAGMLWIGLDAGYRTPIGFNFYGSENWNQSIVTSTPSGGAYAQVSIFITPPSRFYKSK